MLKSFMYFLVVEFPALQVMVDLIQFELSSRTEVFPFKMGIYVLDISSLYLHTIMSIESVLIDSFEFLNKSFQRQLLPHLG